MDLQPFASDSAAAPVLAALAAAKWRKARDLAKELCKKDRTRYLPLLIEANMGLARELRAKGLTQDAEPVLAYLKGICPVDLWEKLNHELAEAPRPAAAALPGPGVALSGNPAAMIASVWPTVLEAAELAGQSIPISAPQWAAVDSAVGAFTPARKGEPGSIDARVAEELEVIHRACAATGDGRWEDAQESLRGLPRQSVFQHWRMFLRGVRHHFLRETESARRCFATLPRDGALARAAATIAGEAAAPSLTKKTPARTRADWWLAVSGQPRTLAAPLAEAQLAWMRPDVRKCLDLLQKAFGRQFPRQQPDLAGLMSDVVLPLIPALSPLEDKRERQWDRVQTPLLQTSDPSHVLCALLRALCLRDAPVLSPHDLFNNWVQMLSLQTRLHGPNPVRDGVGWLWLGEQLMKPLVPGLFPSKDSKHRHGAKALEALQKATALDPGNEAAHLALLRLLTERNEVSARNKLLDQLVKQFPENKEVLVQAGMLAAERRAFTKALQNLRAAQALDPLDRNVRAAIVSVLTAQAWELTKKQRSAEAVWAEIDSLAQDAPGPHYHALARWTHRVRRAVLERSDALAAEAAALAPDPILALFFEGLQAEISREKPRPAFGKAWKSAVAKGAHWHVLTALLEAVRWVCQMKAFTVSESKIARRLMGEALEPTLRLRLREDGEGLLQFIESTSPQNPPGPQQTGVWDCTDEAHWRLAKALAPYSGKAKAEPALCLGALMLGTTGIFFEQDALFEKRLKDVIASAEKKGLTAVAEAARRFQARMAEHHQKTEPLGDTFGDDLDDWEADSASGSAADDAQEDLTAGELQSLPPHLLEILLELAPAVIRGDSRAVDRLRAKALKEGMSAALFENFLETTPRPAPGPGAKKSKRFPDNNHPELDLF
jgi:tetratricopeptide (TPR) repeat protein